VQLQLLWGICQSTFNRLQRVPYQTQIAVILGTQQHLTCNLTFLFPRSTTQTVLSGSITNTGQPCLPLLLGAMSVSKPGALHASKLDRCHATALAAAAVEAAVLLLTAAACAVLSGWPITAAMRSTSSSSSSLTSGIANCRRLSCSNLFRQRIMRDSPASQELSQRRRPSVAAMA